jgi:tetratricopeptide (TPR) repeat protein
VIVCFCRLEVRDLTRSVLGDAMGNLAGTYRALGRHQDALVLQEKALEFQRRVLPENHPVIGSSCFNISLIYCQAGDFYRAIEKAREALRIFRATLPPSHPNVKMAQELVRKIEGDVARRA